MDLNQGTLIKMNKKDKKPLFKKIYFFFKDFENVIELSSGFLVMLAFVITIPYISEMQIVWLFTFLILAVGINLVFKKIKIIYPELEAEYNKENFKSQIYHEIESIKKEVKKLKNENKK